MDTQKVQFNFSQQALADLDGLKEKVGFSSRAETVRSAINLMQWIVEEIRIGNTLYMKTSEGLEKVFIASVSPVQRERGREEVKLESSG